MIRDICEGDGKKHAKNLSIRFFFATMTLYQFHLGDGGTMLFQISKDGLLLAQTQQYVEKTKYGKGE